MHPKIKRIIFKFLRNKVFVKICFYPTFLFFSIWVLENTLDDNYFSKRTYNVNTKNEINIVMKNLKMKMPHLSGELGRPVILPKNLNEGEIIAVADGWKKYGFNAIASNMISVNRTLPDKRHKFCKKTNLRTKSLLKTSVIICFHNEAWSTLLRTVHSVINRSPPHLLQEIILVDDFSSMIHLLHPLKTYLTSVPKVKLIRTNRREGLIRAKIMGALHATAPVITYLDSHCECTTGWLEPLLYRISQNSSTVTFPVIEPINSETFEYAYSIKNKYQFIGGFQWNLVFDWILIPEKFKPNKQHLPIWSPTMPGGIFSIHKDFFQKLGMFDPGFEIWGGENLEISFKIWMCGGTLEMIPCSRVGHVFRTRSPYEWIPGVNVLRRNTARLAEVWLEDYKKYYYQRMGHSKIEFGDVSNRKLLKDSLKCQSFGWYLKNIYPDIYIPEDLVAYGKIRNEIFYYLCLDLTTLSQRFGGVPNIYLCHRRGGNQFWYYTVKGEIRRDTTCLDYRDKDVQLWPCNGKGHNQTWIHDKSTKQIKQGTGKYCMSIAADMHIFQMELCNEAEERQKWTMENFNYD